MEESDSQLQQAEIESSFLDPLIKLTVIRVESFDVLGLGDEPGEFTVEGHEVGGLNFLQNEVDVLFEVPGVNLHSFYLS